MPWTLPQDHRYSHMAILFHWTIAVLVILNLVIGLGHESIPALKGWMGAHKAIGITVLVLTLARVMWRIAHRPPPLPSTVTPAERGVAHAVHWTLYALLILLPLTGWAMVSSGNPPRPLTWFGLFDIPLLPVDKSVSHLGGTGHGLLGWLLLALVLLHIAGALRHHLILRDRTLARILPVAARD